MNRKQLENLYLANEIRDFILKTLKDLFKAHGIKVENIKGYGEIGDIQQKIFKGFILNFFNGWDLEARATLEPVAVNYVHETYLSCIDEDGDLLCVGHKREILLRNGNIKFDEIRVDEEYQNKELQESEVNSYLRFQYYKYDDKHNGEIRWVHIYSETSYG